MTSRAVLGVVFALMIAASAFPAHAAPKVGAAPQQVEDNFILEPDELDVKIWVDGLIVPWSLIFMPDGRALVSERPGRIRLISKDGKLQAEPYATLQVHDRGEAGLMGLALHPQFPAQPFLYAMLTGPGRGGAVNRVVRLRHQGDKAVPDRVLIDNIPAAQYHDGGRIAFGPDRMLYIATGDAGDPELSQRLDSTAGKILRIDPEGNVPADNPHRGNPLWSYGHRNPQGLAWHPGTGELFASEHGPSGEFGLRAHDEINVIAKGANYGWPRVVGATNDAEYVSPIIVWRSRAVPPAGLAFFNDRLYVATLGSEALLRIAVERTDKSWRATRIDRLFADASGKTLYGRLRDVAVGPDGALYVTTSNAGSRGSFGGRDKILRIARKG